MEYSFNLIDQNNLLATIQPSNYRTMVLNHSVDFMHAYLVQRGIAVNKGTLADMLNGVSTQTVSNDGSPTYKVATDSIINMMRSEPTPFSYEIQVRAYYVQVAPSIIDELEQIGLEATSEVAIASYFYWTNNSGKWSNEIYQQTGTYPSEQQKVLGTGAADAAGALNGVRYGATAGALSGLAGVFGGAILCGAASALFSSLGWVVTHWPKDNTK